MDDEDEGDEDMYAEEELEDDLDESNEYQEKSTDKDKLFGGPSRLEYKEPYREANLHALPKRGCKQTCNTWNHWPTVCTSMLILFSHTHAQLKQLFLVLVLNRSRQEEGKAEEAHCGHPKMRRSLSRRTT